MIIECISGNEPTCCLKIKCYFGDPKPKKLLDAAHETLRLKQYSNKTEGAYLNWIKQYILFHDKKHPHDMGASQEEAFLTYLAV